MTTAMRLKRAYILPPFLRKARRDFPAYRLRLGPYRSQSLAEISATDRGLLYLDWLCGEQVSVLNEELGDSLRGFFSEQKILVRIESLVKDGRSFLRSRVSSDGKRKPSTPMAASELEKARARRKKLPRYGPENLTRARLLYRLRSGARERRCMTAEGLCRQAREGTLKRPESVSDLLALAALLPEGDPYHVKQQVTS